MIIITSKEMKEIMEQEVEYLKDLIYSRVEKKINERLGERIFGTGNSAVDELLLFGKIKIDYSTIIEEIRIDYGFESNSEIWKILVERTEKTLIENLAESGWRLDRDHLVPLEEKKE